MYFQVWTAPPGPGASVLRSVFLGFSPVPATTTGLYHYNFDHEVFFLVGQNRYVVLSAQTELAAGLSTSCAFTGVMVPPP
jgi:hypothetical protein